MLGYVETGGRALVQPTKKIARVINMTGTTEPTLDALYTRVEGRLEMMYKGTIDYIKELIDKNQGLQREVDRLKKELESKNRERISQTLF